LASFAAKEASCPTGPALVAIFKGSSAKAAAVNASERAATCAKRKSIFMVSSPFLVEVSNGRMMRGEFDAVETSKKIAMRVLPRRPMTSKVFDVRSG
jgi:hypothetical protein